MIVFHFAADKLRDGSPLPQAGDILPHIADPIPCERGWHGSVSILDALSYTPGFNLCQRELFGTVIAHGSPVDKHCASDGMQLTPYVDVSDVLKDFLRRIVLRAVRIHAPAALRACNVPALTTWADKLANLPDDVSLDAARDAARDASRAASAASAASYAASYASRAASAASAASYAASYASRAANYAACAANYAACDAACAASYAEKKLQEVELLRLIGVQS